MQEKVIPIPSLVWGSDHRRLWGGKQIIPSNAAWITYFSLVLWVYEDVVIRNNLADLVSIIRKISGCSLWDR